MTNEAIRHYDLLIDEGHDFVSDPPLLLEYMNKWDGQIFIDKLNISDSMSVLEIGVGTGRLAVKAAPLCKRFVGLDFSPKTVERARTNLSMFKNVSIICKDFLDTSFDSEFDVIYSSLTFMHIENKQAAIEAVRRALKDCGRFVLSIDKSQSDYIDMGSRKIKIFPDNPESIEACLANAGLAVTEILETELAYIFVAVKQV